MKTTQRKVLERSGWSLFVVIVLMLVISSAQAAGEIAKIIDRTNVAQYKDLLMPALYRAVAKGDFILPTGKLDFDWIQEAQFVKASQDNAGKYDVNSKGDLVEKTSGKIPQRTVYGRPFPQIDPRDPNAGIKILWNNQFTKYRFMGHRNDGLIWFVNRGGLERYLAGPQWFFYPQGRSPGNEVKRAVHNIELGLSNVREPMSMLGSNRLQEFFWDGRDVNYVSYVPSIRRVRKSSGSARSDSYMGSDIWEDVADGFRGDIRTMKWKLIGEKTILVPLSSTQKMKCKQWADGTLIKNVPALKFGFQVPGSKVVAWAPVNATYVPRKVWVVEQMPIDPYYRWGLHVNYIDQESYNFWGKEVNDRAGEFRIWLQFYASYQYGDDGKNNVIATDTYEIIDERVQHASFSCYYSGELFMPSSRLNDTFFTVQNLLKLSK